MDTHVADAFLAIGHCPFNPGTVEWKCYQNVRYSNLKKLKEDRERRAQMLEHLNQMQLKIKAMEERAEKEELESAETLLKAVALSQKVAKEKEAKRSRSRKNRRSSLGLGIIGPSHTKNVNFTDSGSLQQSSTSVRQSSNVFGSSSPLPPSVPKPTPELRVRPRPQPRPTSSLVTATAGSRKYGHILKKVTFSDCESVQSQSTTSVKDESVKNQSKSKTKIVISRSGSRSSIVVARARLSPSTIGRSTKSRESPPNLMSSSRQIKTVPAKTKSKSTKKISGSPRKVKTAVSSTRTAENDKENSNSSSRPGSSSSKPLSVVPTKPLVASLGETKIPQEVDENTSKISTTGLLVRRDPSKFPPTCPKLKLCKAFPGTKEWEEYWKNFHSTMDKYKKEMADYHKSMHEFTNDLEVYKREADRIREEERAFKEGMAIMMMPIPPPIETRTVKEITVFNGYVFKSNGISATVSNQLGNPKGIHIEINLKGISTDDIVVERKFNMLTIGVVGSDKFIMVGTPSEKTARDFDVYPPLYPQKIMIIDSK